MRGGSECRSAPVAAARPSEDAPSTDSQPVRLVVGIGASAGGLDAFRTFFKAMPADSGMAFVLVQHLDPNHPNALPEIIADYTQMPVQVAANGTTIRADHVYVIPPDALL